MTLKKSLGILSLALTTSFVNAASLNIESASDWGNGHASYPASNTIDDSLEWSSRWAADAGGDAVNLVLNLDSVQTVTEVGVSWGKGTDQTHTFEIYARPATSGDWTKVYDSVSSGSSSSIEVYDIDDIQAQQVRIKTFENSAGSDWTNIKEVELYGESGSTGDGEIFPDTVFDDGTSHANYPASNAIDNDSSWSSRWAAEAGGDAVNLTFEFDVTQDLKEVGIAWGQGDSRTHTFELYGRAGTSGTWTKIYDSVSSGDTTGVEIYDVTDMSVLQVRVKAQSNSEGSDWMNITEVELYGASSSDDSGSSNTEIPSIITDGDLFDLEGDNPHPLVDSTTLEFVPLETQYTTSGGGGWRHEYKINTSDRISINDTYEEFSATYKMELSNGAKTIVAQTHGSTISTLMKVFVADSSESGFGDSEANNGIFDVYVRLRGTDSEEVKESLCTIESGDSFDITYVNNYGTMTVSACGNSLSMKVEDDEDSFFKFGNYMQSQDPETREECGTRGDSDSWAECYEEFGITTSKATVTNVSYSSNH